MIAKAAHADLSYYHSKGWRIGFAFEVFVLTHFQIWKQPPPCSEKNLGAKVVCPSLLELVSPSISPRGILVDQVSKLSHRLRERGRISTALKKNIKTFQANYCLCMSSISSLSIQTHQLPFPSLRWQLHGIQRLPH